MILKQILPIILFFYLLPLWGQQLPLFTQYREYQTILNPAAVTTDYMTYEKNVNFGISYREQWGGEKIEGPTTTLAKADWIIDNPRISGLAIGGHLLNDQNGAFKTTSFYGRIAGILSTDPYYGGLALGLSFGFAQQRLDLSDVQLEDPSELIADDYYGIFPDVGFGIFYYHQFTKGVFRGDNIYLGASIPQVLGQNNTFQGGGNQPSIQRDRHFYGTAGIIKYLGESSFIEPTIWVKYVPNAPLHIDLNFRIQKTEYFWVGLGGSSSKTLHVEGGVLLGEDDYIKIGYGFSYSFTDFGPFFGNVHEINVSYALDR